MAMEIYFRKRLCVITIILIYCLTDALCKLQCADNCEDRDNDGGRVLSRRRRALTFPEGSSLQLVVAAQLLFTVGVTCALAFELPSKPIYQITKELREHLQKRLHPEKYTTTEAPKMNSSEEMMDSIEHDDHHRRVDLNYNRLNFINGKQDYYDVMNKHNYYYAGGKPSYFSDKSDNFAATNEANKKPNQTESESIWKKVYKQFTNKDGKKVTTYKIGEKKKGKKKLGNVFIRKHHRVYPVFGKRSVDDHLSEDDIFYMDHHRNTRFELYEKVENFLKGRGKDGTACVLRALCETAQKNQSDEKAPFLIEILRAIFTLPHQVMPGYKKDSHQHYEDAHSNFTADCAVLYPQCKDSIWSPDFRF